MNLVRELSEPRREGFPYPDWDLIAEWVEGRHDESRWHKLWQDIGKQWMEATMDCLPSGYGLTECHPFLIVNRANPARTEALRRILLHSDHVLRDHLGGLVPDQLYGLCPVISFHDEQTFYRYFAAYVPEDGSFGGAGGVYLNQGYGHFAFPEMEAEFYGDVVSHELCHAYLAHLALPLWINEAVTADAEHAVTGRNAYVLDRDLVDRHRSFWDDARIKEFWRGDSFHRDDEGQELSYHLARFILKSIEQGGSTPKSMIEAFVAEADWRDAGREALEKHFDYSPGDCVEALLGSGNWHPDPADIAPA